jgi:hypothetical protein
MDFICQTCFENFITLGVIFDSGSYLLDHFKDRTFIDLKILLKYVMGIQQISSASPNVL